MKKTIKTTLALAMSLLTIASCNKVDLPGAEVPKDDAVRFGVTGITVTTKADVTETLTASLDAGFDVAGFVNGTPDVKMFNELASKNSTWWETATHYYFPLAGTMDFIAAFPSKTGSVITEGVTGVYGIDYLNTENHDLVVATADNVAKTDLVPLTFDHVLSQVIVKMKGSNPYLTYKLTSIGFEVPSEGFYVLRDETGSHAGKVGKWQPSSFIGTDVSSTVIRPIDIASGSFETVSTDDYAKVGDSFTVIPGENIPLNVKWICEDSHGNVVGEYDETVEIDKLSMGKKTTLNILLPCDAQDIRFSITMNGWDGESKDVSMYPTATYVVSVCKDDTVKLPKIMLEEGTEGFITWGDGYIDSLTMDDSPSSCNFITPAHKYDSDFSGNVKIFIKEGKITAAQFQSEPTYNVIETEHAEIQPIKALRFTADDSAKIHLKVYSSLPIPNLEYSMDGLEWQNWNINNSYQFGSDINEYIYIRGMNPDGFSTRGYAKNHSFQFFSDNKSTKISVKGNIMHLLNYEEDITKIPCDYCFSGLFIWDGGGRISLSDASGLELPAMALKGNCYSQMFSGNASLEKAPTILPAMNLAAECYEAMFSRCTSLLTAPVLPATNLAMTCYCYMFENCSSLQTAPALPATNLAMSCYNSMFSGCTSLVDAPELPATTLLDYCYASMFKGCTSLVNAKLPATTLAEECYKEMFSGCTSLVGVPEFNATTLAKNCCNSMFSGCTSLENTPGLPATNLAEECYKEMFSGCTSLVGVPEFNATTLAKNCCNSMFSGCTSLVDAPELPATILLDYCYDSMFKGCTSLVNAELPATTLAKYCYKEMFSGCTSLVDAPELPATTLLDYCYDRMFKGCTSLVNAELPATTLAEDCYKEMFSGCTSLVDAPELPATTLLNYCYESMFKGCTSLVNAELPATNLAANCYREMFFGCTSLTNAPELPAKELKRMCYYNMFKGCTSLNYVKCLATALAELCTSDWLLDTSASGTFVKCVSMNSWSTGSTSGIPEGWTILQAID